MKAAILQLPDGTILTCHDGRVEYDDPRIRETAQLSADLFGKVGYLGKCDANDIKAIARIIGGEVLNYGTNPTGGDKTVVY